MRGCGEGALSSRQWRQKCNLTPISGPLFSLSVMAIRNPRGHEVNLSDGPDKCLDHLAFASLLLRRLEQSGFA